MTNEELDKLAATELCPGVTYMDHADSIARFNLRGVNYNEIQLAAERLRVLEALDTTEELV
jgi:hypothetical protein